MGPEGQGVTSGVQRESAVSSEGQSGQYSLAKILGVWALAAAQMGAMGWVVLPLAAPDAGSHPLGFGVTRLALLTSGLVWLFVLSMVIVRREEGDLRPYPRRPPPSVTRTSTSSSPLSCGLRPSRWSSPTERPTSRVTPSRCWQMPKVSPSRTCMEGVRVAGCRAAW